MALDSAIRKFGWLRSAVFFGLALGWVASAGPAQSECRGVYSQMCTPDTYAPPVYYPPPVYVPSPEELARNEATNLNNQGVEADKRGDLREAIRLYELAVRTSPGAVNQRNLANAYNNLGVEFANKGNGEEALRWYLLAQQYSSDPLIADNVAKAQARLADMARQAEEQRIAADREAQRQANLAAAQQRTAQLLANLRENLPKQTWDGDSTSLVTGLDFMESTAAPVARETPKIPSSGLDFMDGSKPAGGGDYDGDALLSSYNNLAQKLGWSADEQERLDLALKSLDHDGAVQVTGDQINQTWDIISGRGQMGDLAEQAAKGQGPELFAAAAGQQSFNDCAVFALANAAGLPYGIVAVRAGELMRQIEYPENVPHRSTEERMNPQSTIEKHGLNGGEMIMLAEEFGQAEVVPSSEFENTLKGGRPVMISVVPKGGLVKGEEVSTHQVVLTKTFQRGGATWYEIVDSNQGPLRQLYLSAAELDLVLWENGVAFRAEPGTTTKLLR